MKKIFTPLVFKATLLSLFAAFISLSTFSQCPGYFSVATVTPPCGSYATRTFNPGGYLLTNVVTGALVPYLPAM
ncbi:MAG: hypothetical protein U0T75_09395 [Chitinophagales bacterium]